MAITQDYILKGGLRGSDEAANNRLKMMDEERIAGQKNASTEGIAQQNNEAALAQLIKGSQLKTEENERQRQSDLEDVKSLRQLIGKDSGISAGHVKIDPRENAGVAGPVMTPALKAAEMAGGKKAADYVGGGRASLDSNIGQLTGVQKDLEGNKRDLWDQKVGGMLENHPTLMSGFAPSEKLRRDQVQNAMLGMLHDAGIPRPTQWDIQRVFGQVYDSASDTPTNIARVKMAVDKMKSHRAAQEQISQNLQNTGYVTPGVAGNPVQNDDGLAPPAPTGREKQASQPGGRTPIKTEVSPSTGKKRITYSDGTQEIQ